MNIKKYSIVISILLLAVFITPLYCESESELIAALKAELEKLTKEDKFSGAVLIARVGKPIFQEAYGYADREMKIPNTLNTKFRFGSMGKMFTGVGVMQLVQAGKISLDDTVGKYIPDYPNNDVAKVTIHQLLTHTGGTGDIFGPEFQSHRSELKELKDYVVLYGNRGLQFTSGSRHEYSNYGFVLLGRIIEIVSWQSYDTYVREHIFKPAGMTSTDNLPEDQHVSDLAIPYSIRNNLNSLLSAENFLPYRGTSAGGGYSIVSDFLKFADALMSNKLLNAKYTDLVITGKVNTPRPGLKYAYGFEDKTTPDGVRSISHGGGSNGMNGSLMIFPVSHYVVVVLANLDPPAADEVARFISLRLPVK